MVSWAGRPAKPRAKQRAARRLRVEKRSGRRVVTEPGPKWRRRGLSTRNCKGMRGAVAGVVPPGGRGRVSIRLCHPRADRLSQRTLNLFDRYLLAEWLKMLVLLLAATMGVLLMAALYDDLRDLLQAGVGA